MECKGMKVQDTLVIKVPYEGPYHRLRFVLHCSSWLPRPLGIFLWSVLHMLFILLECIRGFIVVILTAAFVVMILIWKMILVLGVLVVAPVGVLFYTVIALYRFLARKPQQSVSSLQDLHIEYHAMISADTAEIFSGRLASNIWEEVIIWYTGIRFLMFTEVLHDFDVISI